MHLLRMNPFQRLTLAWDNIHPYNAVQVLRLREPLNFAGAADAWRRTLRDLQMGRVEIRGARYCHSAGTSPIRELCAENELESYLSAEMNDRFDLAAQGPFRAFVLPRTDEGGSVLGLTYHHWLADSISIRMVLREWFYRIFEIAPTRTGPFPALPDGYERGSVILPFALEALGQWRRLGRRMRRLPEASRSDLRTGHRLLALPEGTGESLHAAAQRQGVKVGDLLLAALARVCDAHLPSADPRRPDLAVGTIRDLRCDRSPKGAFGASLGFATVFCSHELLQQRELLLARIAAETPRYRNTEAYRASTRDRQIAIAAAMLLKPRHFQRICCRRVAVSAGLSNVDASGSWLAQYPQIAQFHRLSPAGPMLPLVVTPTTLDGRFSLGISWRRSLFSTSQIGALLSDLCSEIGSWSVMPSAQSYEPAA